MATRRPELDKSECDSGRKPSAKKAYPDNDNSENYNAELLIIAHQALCHSNHELQQSLIMHDLLLLAIIWIGVYLASFAAHHTRLTPVLWYLFFGAAMVNLGILPEQMPEFIVGFSELGIIVIMFALGFEENTDNFIRSIKRSWGIAFFGAVVPFCVAYFLTLSYWGDKNMALMCGLAMMATAVSLTMVSLKTEGLSKTPAATGIMTSAVLDDIASLALVAILVPMTARMPRV